MSKMVSMFSLVAVLLVAGCMSDAGRRGAGVADVRLAETERRVVELTNPGFEQESGNGPEPAGWTQSRGNPVEWIRDGGRAGTACVQMINRTANESIPLASEPVRVRPGGHYRAEAWVRSDGSARPGLYINFFDDIGRRLDSRQARRPAPGSAWERIAVEAQAPRGAWTVRVTAYSYLADVGTSVFDDVSLTVEGGAEPPSFPRAQPAGKPAVDIGSRRELFIDGYMVGGLAGGAVRRLHAPERRNVALAFDRPWEGRYSGFVAVLEDEQGLVRLYYRGWPRLHGPSQNTCVAVSTNRGVTFDRPALTLFEFDGIRTNNIVLQGTIANNFVPFFDANPDASPDRRYKATASPAEHQPIVALASPDGLRWTQISEGPVLTDGEFDSQNEAFWDPNLRRYVCYYRYYSHDRSIRNVRRSASLNFLDWAPSEPLGYTGAPNEHLYTSAVFPYPRAPHIYIGMPNRYVPERDLDEPGWTPGEREAADLLEGVNDAVLMSSRDGVQFERWYEAWIRPSADSRNWIDRNLYPAWGIVQTTPEEISVYWNEHNRFPSHTLVRGVIRTDGFASVHAGAEPGEILTRPFIFAGRRLEINYETSAVGYVQVALCDEAGRPIPGFSYDDGEMIFGNRIAHTVSWNGGPDVGALAGRTVRLRVRLRDADLYSFHFH